MSGRNWNHEKSEPEAKLTAFLDEKVVSTKRRIKEATGVDITPIYYSAGYKDEDEEQQPYNLSKLLMLIINHTKPEKRAVYINDINKDKKMWEKDDELEDYTNNVQQSLWDSIVSTISSLKEISEEVSTEIDRMLVSGVKAIGIGAGKIVKVGIKFLRGIF